MTVHRPLHFTPRAELEAHLNVQDFVAMCRKSPLLRANSQFDQNTWDTGLSLPGKNGHMRAVFSSRKAAAADQSEPAMAETFLPFAKSVLVYLQSLRPVKSIGVRLAALRCLDSALIEGSLGGRPTAANAEVFDKAVGLAKQQFTADAAYSVAGQLEMLAALMRDLRFITLPARWVHGVKKGPSLGSRISKEAIAAREEKLPSVASLAALGGVFRIAQGTADTLVSSSAALMICAPQRVNELTRLRRDCVIDDRSSEPDGHNGVSIRWPGSKGYHDHAKPMPSALTDVALQAISQILKATQRAQEIALWYEANPKRLFLNRDVEHLRSQPLLTYQDIARVLWGANGGIGSAQQWCKQVGVTALKRTNRRLPTQIRFDTFEGAVIAQLPPHFPYISPTKELKFSQALFVIQRNQLHGNRATFECLIDVLEQSDVAARLGQRDESGITSLFSKYDFKEDDGTPIVMNTHQLRHYLNTLGQVGGLNQMEIAIFSGRKDVSQNQNYDHMTSAATQAPIRRAIAEQSFMGDLAKSPIRHLINRSEFKGLGIPAAHTTKYGHCVHNFASDPCQMFRDCINCTEHLCIKGEGQRAANLRLLREETTDLLVAARTAMNDEEYGADMWVEHQTKTLARIEELLSILGNPATQLGARIVLTQIGVPAPIGHVPNGATSLPSSQAGPLLRFEVQR